MECINDKDEGIFFVTHSQRSYYQSGLYYKEVELITNKIVKVFGKDIQDKEFYSEMDENELENKSWVGRLWGNAKIPITLEINKGTTKLSITIGPLYANK